MKTPLPPVLESKLADFRQRVWLIKLTEGLLAALFGIALSYVLVFSLDRFMETPAWLRATLLVAGAATLGLGLPLKWHRWVWRQRRLEDAARLLKHTFPRLGDQLLGIVELARVDSGVAGRSERLVQAAMEQAAEAVKDRDFRQAVPEARHRQWACAAALVVVLVAAALILVPEAARNALARWFLPWSEVERYTFARVEKLPDRLVVPFAEKFELPVHLAADSRWSPHSATAKISGQPEVTAALKERQYPLSFPPQKEDASLSLSLGDVRKTLRLEPKLRPELTALSVRTQLPEYLKYQTKPVIEVRGGAVSVLKGSQAALEATASRDLARAEVDGKSQKVQGAKLVTEYRAITTSSESRLHWQDQDGLTPREPLILKIHAAEDEAPRITARRETVEQVVLDSEVVLFEVDAQDDYGVQRVGLEWRSVNDDKTRGEKLAAAGAPEKKEVPARATFSATRDGVAPQTLELRAWAEDYLPGRKRSKSAAFILHVLNKTDHALWLTEQFGKWLQAARESYEREQQLHETNKELRAMSVAELDRPENRRRIAQQASAENANAARLSGLTQSGRGLVEQATRNDEFDAARLESWATLLKSLDEIAAKRMPSVADLLKQGSNATGGKASLTSSPSNSSQTPSQSGAKPSPPGTSQPTAPQVSSGPNLPSTGSKPIDPNATPKPPAPSISDRVGSMSKAEPKAEDPNAKPKPPGSGKLRLPTTMLAAAPSKDQHDEKKPEPESPAQAKVETAITEQKDLLAEFAKVSDELSAILASLEASTFVKRFKAASQQQMIAAKDLNEKTLSAFGLVKKPVKEAAGIAEHEKKQSDVVRLIQNDLEAYSQRKPDMMFKNILGQMKQTQVVRALATLGDRAAINLSGSSLAGAEYWADTMDRWAEELVAASECKSCSSCSGDSLPPEIVLKVMQALRDEMKLRDETREIENTRSALSADDFQRQTIPLARKQSAIAKHTLGALEDIRALPQGSEKFAKEINLLSAVVGVMDEARGILYQPETGDPAIAAETEAIELLLQAKRSNPKSGGGGGSSPGGGGGAATASQAALADLGPGGDADSQVGARPVGQATGKAGRELPEEFKTGLDAYFNKLESGGTN